MRAVTLVRIQAQHREGNCSPSLIPAKEQDDGGQPLVLTNRTPYCSVTENLPDETIKVSTDRKQVPAGVLREVKARGISTRELARLLDVPQSAAWRRLHGQTAWTLDDLARLAEAWKVPLRSLIE